VVEGVYFLAMELVEGATVAELLRDGALPEALCAHIGAQVCDALRYAHERFGLVHRDVTPRNVIVDPSGHTRLLDFGIADTAAHTGRGELFGSPGYMSPEQARGEALGPESDLFSLGAVLYEALTARPALPQPGAQTPGFGPDDAVSPELAQLVGELLAAEPGRRPSSAAEAGARFRTRLAQTHPEGVAAALGRRVEQARARAAQPRPDGAHSIEQAGQDSAPRETRSIATSRKLTELMAAGTEPIAGRRARAGRRRIARIGVGPALAALAALALWLLHEPGEPPRPRAAPRPAKVQKAPAPASAKPPVRAQPTAEPPLASTEPSEPARAPAPGRALLSVNAQPWAELRLDGRSIGATPQRGLAVGAGAHVLLLECPPLGRRARVPLKLNAGTHYRVLVDLNADPPQVRVN
jgi:serine/threonine-protein kinase